MIRFLFRFIGLLMLAGAFVALVIDGTRSIAASRLIMTPVRDAWVTLHPATLEALPKRIIGWWWDPVMTTFLGAPFFALLGVLGLLLILIGRRGRAATIGYSSRD